MSLWGLVATAPRSPWAAAVGRGAGRKGAWPVRLMATASVSHGLPLRGGGGLLCQGSGGGGLLWPGRPRPSWRGTAEPPLSIGRQLGRALALRLQPPRLWARAAGPRNSERPGRGDAKSGGRWGGKRRWGRAVPRCSGEPGPRGRPAHGSRGGGKRRAGAAGQRHRGELLAVGWE